MLNFDYNRRSDRIKLFLLIFVCFSIVSWTMVFLSGVFDDTPKKVTLSSTPSQVGEENKISSAAAAVKSPFPPKEAKQILSEAEKKKSKEVARFFAEAYYTYDVKHPKQYFEQSKPYMSDRMVEREKQMIRRQTMDRNQTRVIISKVLRVDHDDPHEIIWSVVIDGEAISASGTSNRETQEFFVTLLKINAEWKVTDYKMESGGD